MVRVNYRNLVLIIIAIIVVLVIVASLLTPINGCYSIGDCKKCWSWVPVARPCNTTCETDPYIEQHNALIDVIICACGKERSTEINGEIEKIYASLYNQTGLVATADSICNYGVPLIKLGYE